MSVAGAIVAALEDTRFRFTDEAGLQAGIAAALEDAGIANVQREYHLSAKDRPDFWVDGVAVEVKVKGSAEDTVRQLLRYAAHPSTTAVVLATTVSRHVTAMPPMLVTKPLHVVHVQRPGGW